MTATDYLDEASIPKIYAFTTPEYAARVWEDNKGIGALKVGYTTLSDVNERISQGLINTPEQQWDLRYVEAAVGDHGAFRDHPVHSVLEDMGRLRLTGPGGERTEWFECTVDDVRAAVQAVKSGEPADPSRLATFVMRPEQAVAVERTAAYFRQYPKEREERPPHFLWNAKMRFGKTFTTYQLALEMGWSKVLVLTFKPAVQDSWRTDLRSHADFEGWQFIGKGDNFDDIDESKPYIWFASFQDVLGRAADGSIKSRLEAMHLTGWDCVVLDEYHFGSWRDTARDLYDSEPSERKEEDEAQDRFAEEVLEEKLALYVDNYLYLSGTPFRSLAMGEFSEDQMFSWTYADEQRAKYDWADTDGPNPYEELPTMVVLTYQMPPDLRRVAQESDFDEFDLNEFFAASAVEGVSPKRYAFKHEDDVQKWLNLIRGQHLPFDQRLTGDHQIRPPLPFEDIRLLATLKHTFWFLPSIAACYAMGDLLAQPQNSFFHDYKIVVSAGAKAGIGLDALPPVRNAISRAGLGTRSITLTCGKLTTGVTVPEWSGIFMLRNLSSPETYFQAAFRIQSPWTTTEVDPTKGEVTHFLKPKCYLFDFAPTRALRLVSDYATELDPDSNMEKEKQVEEFLRYLPVLCYDGYRMQEMKAGDLLDFVIAGTGSTMLARRWQSARLVDVSNACLERLLENQELVARLEEFESFRNLSRDITTTINSERELKKLKTKDEDKKTKKDKKEIDEREKELRSIRKRIQENLIKFATRVPVFMYLTDFREATLKDVIINLEPDLFKKVTNLTIADFKALCEIGVFNATTMDSAVFAFRRFENASLNYAGGGREQAVYGGFESYASSEDVIGRTLPGDPRANNDEE